MRCARCGAEFQRGPGYSRASTAKYCSAKCQLSRRNSRADHTCVVCGNAIKRKPGTRGPIPRACSSACRDILHPPNPPAPTKEMVCAKCGKPFERGPGGRGRKAKYCSRKCGQAAVYSSLSDKACKVCGSLLTMIQARNIMGVCSRECMLAAIKQASIKACAICGKQFEARYSRQVCCSSVCANIHGGNTRASRAVLNTIVATCKHCGRPYKPKAANRLDYCSRDCAYAAKREFAKKCPVCGLTVTQHATGNFCPIPIETTCAHCGKVFVAREGRKCCSKECYKAREARRAKDRERAMIEARAPVTKQCAHCGKEFSRRLHPEAMYCSKRCITNSAKSTRRYRERQSYMHPKSAPVYRAQIFKRDNYVCQLCGRPIDMGLSRGDPMSGTIDHIIPLSKDGWHAPDNVQAAHLWCNSKKSDH